MSQLHACVKTLHARTTVMNCSVDQMSSHSCGVLMQVLPGSVVWWLSCPFSFVGVTVKRPRLAYRRDFVRLAALTDVQPSSSRLCRPRVADRRDFVNSSFAALTLQTFGRSSAVSGQLGCYCQLRGGNAVCLSVPFPPSFSLPWIWPDIYLYYVYYYFRLIS